MNFNPFDMLKNVQKMKEEMQDFQEKLGTLSAQGSAGGDLISVTVNGHMQIVDLKISPECVDPRDVGMLQVVVKSAVNDAMAKIREKIKEEMAKKTGGIIPPGLSGLV